MNMNKSDEMRDLTDLNLLVLFFQRFKTKFKFLFALIWVLKTKA
jgi:hypothetical protein